MVKPKPTNTLSVEQCRAGRALLGWSQEQLAAQAKATQRTVADFERGARQPYGRTLLDLREAMERGGVVFLADGELAAGGPGARLKPGAVPSIEDMLK